MSDTDSALRAIERSARTVTRFGRVIKILCSVLLFIAGIIFLYALSRLSHRPEDFMAYGLLAMAIATITLLVWAQVASQTTIALQARLVASMHYDVEQLVRLARQAARRRETEPAAPSLPQASTSSAPVEASKLAETPELPAATASLTLEIESHDEPITVADRLTPAQVKAEMIAAPTTKECSHCGETIRIDATRCKRCLEKV